MMKETYLKIHKRIEKYSDLIYYEPMNLNEISDLEKELKIEIKSIFKSFLQNFGLVQDITKKINLDKEGIIEHYEFIQPELKNYFPIFANEEIEEDKLLLINNVDERDDHIYEITIDEHENIGTLKKTKKTFQDILESICDEIGQSIKNRTSNKNKIRNTEFRIFVPDKYNGELKLESSEKIGDWMDKYYPNIFGDQICQFRILDQVVEIERNESKNEFLFDIDESLIIDKNSSIIDQIEDLILKSNLEYNRSDIGIIEIE